MASVTEGLSAFRSTVVAMVVDAVGSNARELVLVDPDFKDWPLEDKLLVESLGAFARRPGRRLWILAHDFDCIRSRCPRFLAWRTRFDHAVVARQEAVEGPPLPTALLVDGLRALQVLERDFWRGRVLDDPVQVARLRDQLDARMQRAAPGFGATTLGL